MRKPRYVVSQDGSDKEAAQRVRSAVFEKYGGKCFECGETNQDVLTVQPQRPGGQKVTWYFLRAHGYSSLMNGVPVKLICGNCKMRLKGLT